MNYRNGSAKRQLISIIESTGGRILRVEAKWKFHEVRSFQQDEDLSVTRSSPITNSNNAAFSRTCKQLLAEGKLQEIQVPAEKCDEQTYLRFAIFRSGDRLTRRLREQILPSLYSSQAIDTSFLDEKSAGAFEDFILHQPLEIQGEEFVQFRSRLIAFSRELFHALSEIYSEIYSQAGSGLSTSFPLFVKAGAIAFPNDMSSPAPRSFYSCLQHAHREGNLPFEVVSLIEKGLALYADSRGGPILRHQRKRIYHEFCFPVRKGQGPLRLRTEGAERLRRRFGSLLEQYGVEKPKIKKPSWSFTSESKEYERQTAKLLARLFDANWCRARTVSYLELL